MIAPIAWRGAILVAIGALLFGSAPIAAANNDEVIALAKAGVGDEAILVRIANEPCDYRLEVPDIAALRRNGVSGPVIAAMIRKCNNAVPRTYHSSDPAEAPDLTPGVHVVEAIDGGTRSWSIMPATVAVGSSGGIGTMFLPSHSVISLPGASTVTITTSRRPRIWIVTARPDPRRSSGSAAEGGNPQGFEDILLVQLERKSDRRQLQVGTTGNGVVISGIDPKRIMATTVSRKSEGVLSIVPNVDLASGEYALVAREGSNAYRLYDFTMR